MASSRVVTVRLPRDSWVPVHPSCALGLQHLPLHLGRRPSRQTWAPALTGHRLAPKVAAQAEPGDAVVKLDPIVQVHVEQPSYAVRVSYRARGTALQGANRIWAHIGHSGWRDTLDVELFRVHAATSGQHEHNNGNGIGASTPAEAPSSDQKGQPAVGNARRSPLPPSSGDANGNGSSNGNGIPAAAPEAAGEGSAVIEDEEAWQGTYVVRVSRMPAPWHLEAQLVFKGLVQGREVWDNNAGANWSLALEVTPGEGLVQGLNAATPATRAVVSSLLVRLEALVAARLLGAEQGVLLRTLAWQHELGLIKLYQSIQSQGDADVAKAMAAHCSWLRPPGLNVVHIASEMAPIAKVGGLGDVVMSLAKAHQVSGTLAEIILPKYDCINYNEVRDLRQMTQLDVPWGPKPGDTVRTVVWSGVAEGLPVYFIEPHSGERYFWRGRFYGEPDDAARFCFFSRAALEFLARRQHEAPDIIHCHDWQAASVPPLLKETYRASALSRTRCVLTIHNLAFQGLISGKFLGHMGLTTRAMHIAEPDVMLHGDARHLQESAFEAGMFDPRAATLSLLKGGIVYSDRFTTVSPTYAKEVLGPHLGMGLQGIIGKHQAKFMGILNGIDMETWSPETDPLIPAHFSASDLSGKALCKQRLRQKLGLRDPENPAVAAMERLLQQQPAVALASAALGSGGSGTATAAPAAAVAAPVLVASGRCPLLAVVSRLTQQKGLPLILAGMRFAVEHGAQVVILGSPADEQGQAEWEALARSCEKAGSDVRIVLRHDEALSHLIFAGADMLLVPSMFEPCGLTQLIALRYGTIPVVRETGGLADTVHDVAHSPLPEERRNGFTFAGEDEAAVATALRRAIQAFKEGNDWWHGTLVPRAMRQDHSWSASAQRYLDVYRSALKDA